jgi:hypothetical protein
MQKVILKNRTGFSKSLIVMAATMLLSVSLLACDEDDDAADGRQASAEFCDCYEQHSKDYCFEELKKKWGNYVNSAFIDAFNQASTCDAELYYEQIGK